jgi:hypothetical protein
MAVRLAAVVVAWDAKVVVVAAAARVALSLSVLAHWP